MSRAWSDAQPGCLCRRIRAELIVPRLPMRFTDATDAARHALTRESQYFTTIPVRPVSPRRGRRDEEPSQPHVEKAVIPTGLRAGRWETHMSRRSVISALVAAAFVGSAFVSTSASAGHFHSGGGSHFSRAVFAFHAPMRFVRPLPAFRSNGANAHYDGRFLPIPMHVCKGKNCPKPNPPPTPIPGGCRTIPCPPGPYQPDE